MHYLILNYCISNNNLKLINFILFILVLCFTYPVYSQTYHENFESGTLSSDWKHSDSGGAPQTLSKLTNSLTCNGTQILKSKAIYPPDYRTEVVFKSKSFAELIHEKEYWMGVAISLSTDWKDDGKVGETLFQTHHRADLKLGDVGGGSTPLSLRTKNGQWLIHAQTKSKKICTTPCAEQVLSQYIGQYQPGVWTEFVFNVKFTHTNAGFLRVWKNNELVVNYSGPIGYNDERGPFIKLGVYKPLWQYGKSIVNSRTVYHDDFKIKEGSGSPADVSPNCGNTNTEGEITPPDNIKIIQ